MGVVGVQRPEETMGDAELEKLCAKSLTILVELNEADGEEEFYDAITGQRLRSDMVRAARKEELE